MNTDIDEIVRWFFADRERLLSDDVAVEAFQLLGPRWRFIKTVEQYAAVLDVGAGDGTMHISRSWPYFKRPDIKIYAYAGEMGKDFHLCDGFELGMWPQRPPVFPGVHFNAIMACNFIEHIDEPLTFVRWACSRVASDGWIYLEWPRPVSCELPTSSALRAKGIEVTTGNYYDDLTHRSQMPLAEDVHSELIDCGMQIESAGVVRVPFLDGELASAARNRGDLVAATLAYWSFTGWCQYVVARREA
jgi:hypothetical protein